MRRAPRARALLRRLAGLLLALAVGGCGAAATLPQVHSEGERLAIAHQLIGRGDYSNAAELLKTYVQNNGAAAHVDEAIYLLGMCYLKTKDYPSAQTELQRLITDFPESDSAGSGSFLLGEAYWGQSRGPDFDQEDTRKALAQWEAYTRNYPEHWRRAEAEQRIGIARARLATKLVDTAELYWKLGYTEPARIYDRRVLDEYWDTPLVGDATLNLALCDAREGRKAEAIAALDTLIQQHPNTPLALRATKEREKVERGKIHPLRKPPKQIAKPEGPPGAGPTP